MKTDFFIAGRTRNTPNIKLVLDAVRAHGKTAYCFIESDMTELSTEKDPHKFMEQFEALSQDDPFIRQVFELDMAAERDAENFLVVLPAGNAAHIESGVAYGLGKKCYAIGEVERTESLYCVFDEIFPDLPAFEAWLKTQQ